MISTKKCRSLSVVSGNKEIKGSYSGSMHRRQCEMCMPTSQEAAHISISHWIIKIGHFIIQSQPNSSSEMNIWSSACSIQKWRHLRKIFIPKWSFSWSSINEYHWNRPSHPVFQSFCRKTKTFCEMNKFHWNGGNPNEMTLCEINTWYRITTSDWWIPSRNDRTIQEHYTRLNWIYIRLALTICFFFCGRYGNRTFVFCWCVHALRINHLFI